jgi:hypothetical protein
LIYIITLPLTFPLGLAYFCLLTLGYPCFRNRLRHNIETACYDLYDVALGYSTLLYLNVTRCVTLAACCLS